MKFVSQCALVGVLIAACAVPVGIGSDGFPRGVTLVATGESDGLALGVGALLHHATSARRGATSHPLGPAVPCARGPGTDTVPCAIRSGRKSYGEPEKLFGAGVNPLIYRTLLG